MNLNLKEFQWPDEEFVGSAGSRKQKIRALYTDEYWANKKTVARRFFFFF